MGEIIRRIRRQRGMTQEELAGRVGVTQSYISRIERGSRVPQPGLTASIAAALGEPPAMLHDAIGLTRAYWPTEKAYELCR